VCVCVLCHRSTQVILQLCKSEVFILPQAKIKLLAGPKGPFCIMGPAFLAGSQSLSPLQCVSLWFSSALFQFCFTYFSDRVLLSARAALNLDPPDFHLLCSWNYRCELWCPAPLPLLRTLLTTLTVPVIQSNPCFKSRCYQLNFICHLHSPLLCTLT
jgi:hypothetical protein